MSQNSKKNETGYDETNGDLHSEFLDDFQLNFNINTTNYFINNYSADSNPVPSVTEMKESTMLPVGLYPIPILIPPPSIADPFNSVWETPLPSYSQHHYFHEEEPLSTITPSACNSLTQIPTQTESEFMAVLNNPEFYHALQAITNNSQALRVLQSLLLAQMQGTRPIATTLMPLDESYPPQYSEFAQSLPPASNAPAIMTAMTMLPPSHRSTKLYACVQCDREFSRRFNLQTHMQTHMPERPRPYGCEQCDKKFVRVHDLNRHREIHGTNAGAHVCPDQKCRRAFTRKDALRRHMTARGCKGPELV
ncbi:hypothetical protein HK096_006164 [Nowakowskiella sp. JEL0078]|nr:hypothetical protein HK096_006164 [Nowakowskiella sp. JEL0078]